MTNVGGRTVPLLSRQAKIALITESGRVISEAFKINPTSALKATIWPPIPTTSQTCKARCNSDFGARDLCLQRD